MKLFVPVRFKQAKEKIICFPSKGKVLSTCNTETPFVSTDCPPAVGLDVVAGRHFGSSWRFSPATH
jgi:hypothetical protein